MSDECWALAEGFPTVNTLVRPLSGVSSPVNSKGGALAEALPTLLALVRLFSSVESLVFSKGRAPGEHFPRVPAFRGSPPYVFSDVYWGMRPNCKFFRSCTAVIEVLPHVYLSMLNYGWTVAEGFPTFSTFVRFYLSMNSLMLTKVRASAEGFSTFTTFIWFFSSVAPLVLTMVGTPAESFPTLIALVWFLSGVCSLMFNQVCTLAKGFPTFIAFKRLFSIRNSSENFLESHWHFLIAVFSKQDFLLYRTFCLLWWLALTFFIHRTLYTILSEGFHCCPDSCSSSETAWLVLRLWFSSELPI